MDRRSAFRYGATTTFVRGEASDHASKHGVPGNVVVALSGVGVRRGARLSAYSDPKQQRLRIVGLRPRQWPRGGLSCGLKQLEVDARIFPLCDTCRSEALCNIWETWRRHEKCSISRTAVRCLLISGSKVRVLDGPPIRSGTSAGAGVPDLLLAPNWYRRACAVISSSTSMNRSALQPECSMTIKVCPRAQV